MRARGLEWQTIMLTAGVVAVVLVAIVAVGALRAASHADRDRERAVAVRIAASALLHHLADAETGQRGYLLTGDPAFLEPYHAGVAALDATLARLAAALDGRHPTELVELRALAAAIRTALAATIAVHDRGDPGAAIAIVATGHNRRNMDRARQLIADRWQAESDQAGSAHRRTTRASAFARSVIVVGCAVSALALIVGLGVGRLRNRERAAALSTIKRHVTALEATDRQRAQAALALNAANVALTTTNDALARSNRDLDQFAYAASHDLKAPLRAISSLATWIEHDLPEPVAPQQREHLRLLRTRVERMSSLIEGILAYARAGKQRGAIVAVDVRRLVTETRDLLAVPAGVQIDVTAPPWPTIESEVAPLQQVWINLLGNAIKHGVPGGGAIEAGAGVVGGEQRYWVKDDGGGIAPEHHERIFEMFQRLASRDEVEGAGIGLAVVRKLVESQHGRIWIESALGHGTTVCFTWGERA